MTKAIYTSDKIAGTPELVRAVLSESNPTPTQGPAWRVTRAAVAKAQALLQTPAEHPFMTQPEFERWLDANGLDRRGGAPILLGAMEMTPHRKGQILGGAAITRIEALACAHFGLRLPMPTAPGDHVAFARLIRHNFGRPLDLAKCLGVTPRYITDRMAGFQIRARKRIARTPEASLIRAVDWIIRVGPFSPFGFPLPRPSGLNMEKF